MSDQADASATGMVQVDLEEFHRHRGQVVRLVEAGAVVQLTRAGAAVLRIYPEPAATSTVTPATTGRQAESGDR